MRYLQTEVYISLLLLPKHVLYIHISSQIICFILLSLSLMQAHTHIHTQKKPFPHRINLQLKHARELIALHEELMQ